MTTAILAGALANKPGNGGEAWVRMSWVRALEELGFGVLFLEQIGRDALVDHQGQPAEFDESWNVAYFDAVIREFGLTGKAALLPEGGGPAHGLSWSEVMTQADSAALLVNIGGHLSLPEVKDRVAVKAYVDIDPGFTQIWEDTGIPGARLQGHDHFFTIAARIGAPDCPIPTLGLRWVPLRQPVSLESWPPTNGGNPARFTTVASWRGAFGPVELHGRWFGAKVHQFRRFLDVPRRAPAEFEVALSIHPGDRQDLEDLRSHGWKVVDPSRECGDPWAFRRYVQESGAEFSVAQGVYVETACGWFSDRTTRYLASGKPALIQDTGLEGVLPTGEGLVTFRTVEEAVDGSKRILREPALHARAARALAEEFFTPARALEPLLAETGVRP